MRVREATSVRVTIAQRLAWAGIILLSACCVLIAAFAIDLGHAAVAYWLSHADDIVLPRTGNSEGGISDIR